jgi:hypothetical protein
MTKSTPQHLVKNENPHCTICGDLVPAAHYTEEHNENFVAEQEPCDECGAPSGEKCKPSCRWSYCPTCGLQIDECKGLHE